MNKQKLIKIIKEKLKEIESDERLSYPIATVIENAPLALIQLDLETKRNTLKWILKKAGE